MDVSIDSILSSVMGNEELMNKIRDTVKGNNGDTSASLEDVISLISPTLKEDKSYENDTVNNEIKDTIINKESSKDFSDSIISSLSNTISKNASLLIALKPYLCKERCQMIDGIIKISKLANTLKLI